MSPRPRSPVTLAEEKVPCEFCGAAPGQRCTQKNGRPYWYSHAKRWQAATDADCQGHCWISCGPVEMSDAERSRIRRDGYRISDAETVMRTWDDTFWCEALTGAGKCAVYEHRPMLCRLWGVTRSMPCPHGCQPERWLSEEESYRLLLLSVAAGGGAGSWCPTPADIDRLVAAGPSLPGLMDRVRQEGRHGIWLRLTDHGKALPPEITRRRRR